MKIYQNYDKTTYSNQPADCKRELFRSSQLSRVLERFVIFSDIRRIMHIWATPHGEDSPLQAKIPLGLQMPGVPTRGNTLRATAYCLPFL
jgi:hypothetical protein